MVTLLETPTLHGGAASVPPSPLEFGMYPADPFAVLIVRLCSEEGDRAAARSGPEDATAAALAAS